MKQSKKTKRLSLKTMTLLLMISFLLFAFPLVTYAAPSWVRAGEGQVYGYGRTETERQVDEEEEDSIIKHLKKLFSYMAQENAKTFNREYNTMSISLDGIILGKLSGFAISIGKFELHEYNPYGVLAGYGYAFVRNAFYSLLFLYFLVRLVLQLFNNGPQKRAELKELIYNIFFIFAMLSFIPALTHIFIVLRDGMIKLISGFFWPSANPSFGDIFAMVFTQESAGLLRIILLLAYVLAGWVFLGNYVSTALQEMGLFVISPAILLLSLKPGAKRLFETWCNLFFSNLIIPFIDYLFLLFPVLLKTILQDHLGFFISADRLEYAAVAIVALWSVIPARNYVIHLFGNNMGPGRGMAMAAMGMMAMRAMASGRGGGGSLEGGGGLMENMANAARHETNAHAFEQALEDQSRSLQNLDQFMAASDAQNAQSVAQLTTLEESYQQAQEAAAATQGVEEAATQAQFEQELVAQQATSGGEETAEEAALQTTAEDFPYQENGRDYSFREVGENIFTDSPPETLPQETLPEEALSQEVFGENISYPGGVSEFSPPEDMEQMPAEPSLQESLEGVETVSTRDMDADFSSRAAGREMETPAQKAEGEALAAGQEGTTTMATTAATGLTSVGQSGQAGGKPPVTQSERFSHLRMSNLEKLDNARKAAPKLKIKAAEAEHNLAQLAPQYRAAEDSLEETTKAYNKFEDSHSLDIRNGTLSPELAQTWESLRAAKDSTQASFTQYQEKYEKARQTAAEARQSFESCEQNIKQRSDMETNLAHMDKVYGGTGERYETAAQYDLTLKQAEIIRKQANYRNFTASAVSHVLSPEERHAFAKERALKEATQATVRAIGAGLGGAAMLAGGPSAALTGGMAAKMAVEAGQNLAQQAANLQQMKQVHQEVVGNTGQRKYQEEFRKKEQSLADRFTDSVKVDRQPPIRSLSERARKANEQMEVALNNKNTASSINELSRRALKENQAMEEHFQDEKDK